MCQVHNHLARPLKIENLLTDMGWGYPRQYTGADWGEALMIEAETSRLVQKIRAWLALFIVGLVLSGVTAFPLEREKRVVHRVCVLIRQATRKSFRVKCTAVAMGRDAELGVIL